MLDPAGLREDLRELRCALPTMSPARSNRIARELVVPWSMAST
jgi:hypothetical protein